MLVCLESYHLVLCICECLEEGREGGGEREKQTDKEIKILSLCVMCDLEYDKNVHLLQ